MIDEQQSPFRAVTVTLRAYEGNAMTWHLKVDKQHTKDIVDELMMRNAYVQFRDLGDVYMLTVENDEQHIHITIPARRNNKAFVFEQFNPNEGDR